MVINRQKIYLFIGPEERPITGQAEAFRMLFDSRRDSEVFIHYPPKPLSIRSILFVLKLSLKVLTRRVSVTYLTISRSERGFLRDMIIFSIALLARSKVIVHLHGSDFADFFNRQRGIMRWTVRFFYTRVTAAIVLLDPMKDEFRAFPHLRLHTIPNSVSADLAKDSKSRVPTDPFGKTLRVLYLSNLIPTKGIAELIEAVERANNCGMDISLDICGRTGFDAVLDQKVRAASVSKSKIVFHGPVYGPQKTDLLAETHVLALPSYYPNEAQPISILEGMYYGSAILYSNHNYLPAFLPQGVGLMVEPMNSNAILLALTRYFQDRYLLERHASEARIVARSDYSTAAYCDGVRKVLERYS